MDEDDEHSVKLDLINILNVSINFFTRAAWPSNFVISRDIVRYL